MPESPIDFYHVSLKLFLRNERGEILALATPRAWGEGERYDVPGGRINEDEFTTPLEQVLLREVAEELGPNVQVDLRAYPVAIGRHVLPWQRIVNQWQARPGKDLHIFYVFFEGIYRGGDLALIEEHTSAAWIDPKNAESRSHFIPGVADALQRYVERSGS